MRKLRTVFLCIGLFALVVTGCGKEKTVAEFPTEDTENEISETISSSENENDDSAEAQSENKQSEEVQSDDMQSDEDDVSDADTVEKEESMEEPDETQYTYEVSDIVSYMNDLQPDGLCIVIWNYDKKYAVNLKEGQHYQLQEHDEVCTLFKGGAIGYGYSECVETRGEMAENTDVSILNIDYSKLPEDGEFLVRHLLDSGEIEQFVVYLEK